MHVDRTKAVVIRLIYNYTGIALAVVQGVLLVPIYLAHIDSGLYGAWLATGNLLSAMTIMDFGFTAVLSQQIAVGYGKKDCEIIGHLTKTGLVTCSILFTLPFLIGVVASPFMPTLLHVSDSVQIHELRNACIIAGGATSLMMFVYSTAAIIHGLQREAFLSVVSFISWITGIITTVLLLYGGFGLCSIPYGFLLRGFMNATCNAGYVFYLLRNELHIKVFHFKWLLFKNLFRRSSLVFSGKLLKTVGINSESFFVGTILMPEFTTIYVLTKKSTEIVSMLSVRIIEVLVPGIAHLTGEGDQKRLREIIVNVLKVSLVFGIISVGGIYLLNKTLLELWVGSDYYGGDFLTGMMCISAFLTICSQTFYNALFGLGFIETAGWAATIEGIIKIPASALLCYLYGLNGVVIAAIISVLPSGVFMQSKKILDIIGIRLMEKFLDLLQLILKSLVPLILMIFVKRLWMPQGWISFVGFGGVYLIVSVLFLYAVNYDLRRIFEKYSRQIVKNVFSFNRG